MLLWIPPEKSLEDHDEKAAKLLRQTRARARKTLVAMSFCCMLLILMLSCIELPATKSALLRAAKEAELGEDPRFPLPPDSIYRLSVENQQGELVSLRRFAGNVSLVVNTACR